MNEKISSFKVKATAIGEDIRALLLEVRAFLDETENDDLFESESDLYDASECLQDFADSCDAALEAEA